MNNKLFISMTEKKTIGDISHDFMVQRQTEFSIKRTFAFLDKKIEKLENAMGEMQSNRIKDFSFKDASSKDSSFLYRSLTKAHHRIDDLERQINEINKQTLNELDDKIDDISSQLDKQIEDLQERIEKLEKRKKKQTSEFTEAEILRLMSEE